MTDRLKYFPVWTIITLLFVLSIGFNIVLLDKVNKLTSKINTINSPVGENELLKIMDETERLSKKTYTNDTNNSNLKYNIKTREPIKNAF